MSGWFKVLAVLFVLPVFAIVFFSFAPKLQNDRVLNSFRENVEKELEISKDERDKRLSFIGALRLDQHCFDGSADSRTLIENFGLQSVCDDFERFQWARLASAVIIALSLLHLVIAFGLARNARRSKEALLSSFKASWTSATFFTLVILLGQTVLAAATLFYLTVLFTDRYFPKLILALLLAGAWAFFKIAKLLVSKQKIESNEPTSEEVTEDGAPALWGAVRDAAKQLGTNPPDTILLGMSQGFYVTEFPVKHANGVSRGRTLHLSIPMMQLMPKDEIFAIIGHELGHFKGEDTVMTQKLSPVLHKSSMTMAHMAEAGAIGAPAMYAMNVFQFLFEKVISAYRRERELHADAFGASITHNETMARALVRYSYQIEAYGSAFHEHLTQKAALEASLAKYQDEYGRDDRFWEDMSVASTPHPFDSHPPLTMRLDKLGYKVSDVRHQAQKKVETSSFDVWMKGKAETSFASAMKEQANLVQDAQTRLELQNMAADQMTADVIKRHFPQITLRPVAWQTALVVGFFLIISAISFGLAVMFGGDGKQSAAGISGAIGIATILLLVKYMRDWHVQALTLNHLGLQLSTWKDMLKFADVEQIQHFTNNNTEAVIFTFKEKRAPLAKKPIFPFKRKKITVQCLGFSGIKQNELVVKIFKYYTRSID